MALAAADAADLRRFLGYPPIPGVSDALAAAVVTLSPEVETVVIAKLATLRTVEAALESAYSGLDTKKAAVYERDLAEVQRRVEHFRLLRVALAAILGIDLGPWLGLSGFPPVAFVV